MADTLIAPTDWTGCRICRRTTRRLRETSVCYWCWDRWESTQHRAAERPARQPDPIAAPPLVVPNFEPPPAISRFILEFAATSVVGFAMIAMIRFVTATNLHGLDLRGLLPLTALPHMVVIASFSRRAIGLVHRGTQSSRLLVSLMDAAVALGLAFFLMVFSWQHGPRLIAQSAGESESAYTALCLLGLDLDGRDGRGYTALIYAAEAGDLEAVTYLVERGASLDARDTAGSALTHSAAKGHLPVVIFLVERGSNVAAVNRHGHSAYALSVKHGRADVARFLRDFEGGS